MLFLLKLSEPQGQAERWAEGGRSLLQGGHSGQGLTPPGGQL